MGLDARVRYTQMVIKNSFTKLLEQKPLNKVTVKEICELSEINRATFYKYYCDAYDLLEKLESEFLSELQKNVQESAQKDFRDTFTLIMVSIKADGKLYQTLFSENGDPHFPSRILDLCYKQSVLSNDDKKLSDLSLNERTWLYYFIAHGCSGILNQWITGGMIQPINEVVDFAYKLVINTSKQFEKEAI